MSKIYNKYVLKDLRQYLRNNSTRPERLFWEYLKQRRLNGYKFQRQYSVGFYIVDFYCPKLRLAIELDGFHHFKPEVKKYDKQRQEYIEDHNIKVIRFTNKEVVEDVGKVLKEIINFIEKNHR